MSRFLPVGNGSAAKYAGFAIPIAIFFMVPMYRLFWPYKAVDVIVYLLPWYRHIIEHGQFGAFGIPFSNYNPPYLYLLSLSTVLDGIFAPAVIIKLLSVGIVCALAGSIYHLLKACGFVRVSATAGALVIFAVPTVVLNAVCFSQCDALWAAACVMAVAAVIRDRPVPMLLWCGAALAVKLQAMFIAPFALGMLLTMRPAYWHFALPAVSYSALLLPALILGWPASDLATIYLRQAEHGGVAMSLSAPNIWLALSYAHVLRPADVYNSAYAVAAVAGLWIVHRCILTQRTTEHTLLLALASALMMPYFLPGMHERYFFLADILAVALCIVAPSRANIAIAVLVQAGSVAANFLYLTFENDMFLDAKGYFYVAAAEGQTMFFGPICIAAMTAALILVVVRLINVPTVERSIGRGGGLSGALSA